MELITNPLLRRRRGEQDPEPDRFFRIRNWLNIIFMLGAVIGVCTYFFIDHNTGIIIVLASMIFKMAESALRFIR